MYYFFFFCEFSHHYKGDLPASNPLIFQKWNSIYHSNLLVVIFYLFNKYLSNIYYSESNGRHEGSTKIRTLLFQIAFIHTRTRGKSNSVENTRQNIRHSLWRRVMILTTSTIIGNTPLNFPFNIFKYKKGIRKKVNTAWVCSTMVLLLGINPLLDNYFSHLGKHHWQQNFQKRSLATCIFLSSTGWQILVNASQKIKGKTTGAQRTTNWSYYRNKYQTTIGKIFKFYAKPETPDYWHTHQQAWSRVFNHKSNKYWICACPAHLI